MKNNKQVKKALDAVKSIPNVWRNLLHLTEAACLVGVAGFAFWASFNHVFDVEWTALALRFAAVVIALRGAVEFLKQLNRK